MKQRYYIDLSVVVGYYDEKYKEATTKLYDRLDNDEVIFVISELLEVELTSMLFPINAPFLNYSSDRVERIKLSKDCYDLAQSYIDDQVTSQFGLELCLHIAMATINKVDVFVSWNYKYYVNLDKIRAYNSVNLRLGYSMIEIRSPRDLVFI